LAIKFKCLLMKIVNRDLFDLLLISNVRDIVSSMFDLFIISVWNLDRVVASVLNSLIVSESLLDWNLVSNSSLLIISVSSVIRDLFVGDFWLVISVVLLDGYVLHVGLRLGSLVHRLSRESLMLLLSRVGVHCRRVHLGLCQRLFHWKHEH